MSSLLSVGAITNAALRMLEKGISSVYSKEGGFLVLDEDRVRMNNYLGMERGDSDAEYRYEERGLDYNLSQWSNAKVAKSHGFIDSRPEWLVNIIDMAKIGGHARRISQPPPDLIVWFTTDSKGNLVKFIEME